MPTIMLIAALNACTYCTVQYSTLAVSASLRSSMSGLQMLGDLGGIRQ